MSALSCHAVVYDGKELKETRLRSRSMEPDHRPHINGYIKGLVVTKEHFKHCWILISLQHISIYQIAQWWRNHRSRTPGPISCAN